MHELIVPFGIATFTMLIVTAVLGLGLWKLHFRWIRPGYHYASAAIAVGFGIIHLLLNLTAHH